MVTVTFRVSAVPPNAGPVIVEVVQTGPRQRTLAGPAQYSAGETHSVVAQLARQDLGDLEITVTATTLDGEPIGVEVLTAKVIAGTAS
jgi:hypothetical protein